ncbi:MAG: deoxyguanosinetriphosphate triphosphohydrolase [Actinobacteria bacterium]|nr:deoxyguanosinetriphosphate triphosphohydrolase [Actinomycetota bacterium]
MVDNVNIPSGYALEDIERWVIEPNKGVDRTEFARDRARVMHSSALRRLGVKTQVMVAGQEDFPRTRLTHSLECAQVGRELGASLGCNPDLVDAACLSHDLGHPPFGHNGESALNELAADIGGFEGNAQSFRLLTRLEPKSFTDDKAQRPHASIGLNLTRSTLDAASKYPWARKPGSNKFGVYDDDVDVFNWMRAGRAGTETCFEAQVMDWSDDVSYSVHDIEDAIHAGHLTVEILASASGRTEVIEIARSWYGEQFEAAKLDEALQRLYDLPCWPQSFDGTTRAMATLKNTTSTLVGRFCIAAAKATREEYGPGALTRYSANLVVPDEARYEVTALKALAARFVMNRTGADSIYAHQRQQIADLVVAISDDPIARLDSLHRDLWINAQTPSAKTRCVIDQVASLTDVSVVQWHTTLCA